MSEDTGRRYGVFSKLSYDQHGGYIYKTIDGETVVVTGVSATPDGAAYLHADKVMVGELLASEQGGYVGRIEPGRKISDAPAMVYKKLRREARELTTLLSTANAFPTVPGWAPRRGRIPPIVGVSTSNRCTCSVPTKTSRRGLCTSCGKEAKSCS
jgi:hypothetical protein